MMHPQTQSNHLSLILLAFLTDFTNALPQTVQARPATVADRDQSLVNSSMKWVQDNLFYTLLLGAVLVVVIFFIVKCWRKKKGKKDIKTTATDDRGPSAEEKAAARADQKAREGAMAMFIRVIGGPFVK